MLHHEQITAINSFHQRNCLAHPQHPVVGVCAPCLKERLSALAKTSASCYNRWKTTSNYATRSSGVAGAISSSSSACSDGDEDEEEEEEEDDDGEERFEDAQEELLQQQQQDINNDVDLQEEEQNTGVASLRHYHQMPAAIIMSSSSSAATPAVNRKAQPTSKALPSFVNVTVPSSAANHSLVPFAYDADFCCNIHDIGAVRNRPAFPTSGTDDRHPPHRGISSYRQGGLQITMDASATTKTKNSKTMWITNGADVVIPSWPSTDIPLPSSNQCRQTPSPLQLQSRPLIPPGAALPARHSSASITETVRLPSSAAEKPLGNNWFSSKSKSVKMAPADYYYYYYRSSPTHTGTVPQPPASAIPQMHMMKPGRKSASDAVLGNNHVQYRQAYMNYAAGRKSNADGIGISSNTQGATDRIHPSCGTRNNASGTWISSFFRRKKRSGNCDDNNHNSCLAADAASATNSITNRLPGSSTNVGTPMWNGLRSDRPNLKQMIKQKLKLTEPSKGHQPKLKKGIESRRSTSPAPLMMGLGRGDRRIQSTATADRPAPSGADSGLDGNNVGEKKQQDNASSSNDRDVEGAQDVAEGGKARCSYDYCKCSATGHGRRSMNEDYNSSITAGFGEVARSMSDLRVRSKSWGDIDSVSNNSNNTAAARDRDDLEGDDERYPTDDGDEGGGGTGSHLHLGREQEDRENLLGHRTTDGFQHSSTTTLANLMGRVDADKKWIGVPAPTISPCWRSKCVPDAGMTLFFHEFL